MTPIRGNDRPGLKYHLKVHSFRTLTVIAAWALIVAAFADRRGVLRKAGVADRSSALSTAWY
ncbi:hypothetical protein [Bradyrhizobium sp. LTSPM299]|uniref:hypothetical protein n=1 Tax=Bradyrhizobium sp. LTSPM299 TaxID=1619233 RepID=UPI0012E10643|nr:hypothetical protein [Bradyrhizobium sp. LTSPM299]